ncbi:MAG: malto-oligosyltrehalose trehalohydrolase [Pirellulaceae bacterium]
MMEGARGMGAKEIAVVRQSTPRVPAEHTAAVKTMLTPALPTKQRSLGSLERPAGAIRWKVWAPRAQRVELVLGTGSDKQYLPMEPRGRNAFAHTLPDVPEGQRYAYRLDGERELPDPCSLSQPDGPHAASAVVRPSRFRWTDQDWKGISRRDLVLYELHVGTFTPEGTFAAIAGRLPALRELGITAIEIMPIGQFPGTRNWGYDGAFPYAVQNSYGGPLEFQQLVEACHGQGIAVILDVVYNHLGPEGNYLGSYGPYFTDRYKTPWGEAVNFDGPGSDHVRDYVLDNARMWLAEFHVDGLRLDAVHTIFDFSARHILGELQEVAEQESERAGRQIHLIAESDLNDPRILRSRQRGGFALAAQWGDDFHHAVHACLTGERHGYYEDFGRADQLAHTFEHPFVFTGQYSLYRDRRHGAPSDDLPGDRFVACLQNHDQIGNRTTGDRMISILGSPGKQRLATSLLLLSPYLPLIFMGEEYGEEQPFPFFCSFGDPQLVEAVRQGRKAEFAAHGFEEEFTDPFADETFESAKLAWQWPTGSFAAGLRLLYADLLRARREWPPLQNHVDRSARLVNDLEQEPLLELVRGGTIPESPGTLLAYFNFAGEPQLIPATAFFDEFQVAYSSEAPRYGGSRTDSHSTLELLPYECLALCRAGELSESGPA